MDGTPALWSSNRSRPSKPLVFRSPTPWPTPGLQPAGSPLGSPAETHEEAIMHLTFPATPIWPTGVMVPAILLKSRRVASPADLWETIGLELSAGGPW